MGARILVIEDNRANLDLMTYLLESFGHVAIGAEDGLGGLEAARRERPELAICDIQLPDIGGLEVARRMRADPDLRSIPLLAVTALAMVGDRDRVLAAGFDGYLSKPIDPETFVPQMEVFLPHRLHGRAGLAHAAPADQHWDEAPQRYTILVVDNLPVNLELARGIFSPSGYRVITAGSMSEGLALARDNFFHLIISDVMMSGGSGYDFLLAARADPQLKDIPFVLLTSTMLDDKDRDHGLALGADRFLRRPIEPGVLLAEIEACLREKEGREWRPS